MRVFLNGKETTVEGVRTVGAVLAALGLSPEAHVVVRDGEPLTEDRSVGPGDTLDIVRAISGGRP